jgi:hypothetical protein
MNLYCVYPFFAGSALGGCVKKCFVNFLETGRNVSIERLEMFRRKYVTLCKLLRQVFNRASFWPEVKPVSCLIYVTYLFFF